MLQAPTAGALLLRSQTCHCPTVLSARETGTGGRPLPARWPLTSAASVASCSFRQAPMVPGAPWAAASIGTTSAAARRIRGRGVIAAMLAGRAGRVREPVRTAPAPFRDPVRGIRDGGPLENGAGGRSTHRLLVATLVGRAAEPRRTPSIRRESFRTCAGPAP